MSATILTGAIPLPCGCAMNKVFCPEALRLYEEEQRLYLLARQAETFAAWKTQGEALDAYRRHFVITGWEPRSQQQKGGD